MKNVKMTFFFFLCLFFSAAFMSAQEIAVEVEVTAKKELICEGSTEITVTIGGYCSSANYKPDAIKEYKARLNKSAGRYVTCKVTIPPCEEGEICTPYYGGDVPGPGPNQPGCDGYYFPGFTKKVTLGCSPCKTAPSDTGVTEFVTIDLNEVEVADTDHTINGANDMMEVFPNPADYGVNVELHITETLKNVTVSVFNMEGRMMINREVGEINKGFHNLWVNTDNLETGIYMIALKNEDRSLQTVKLSIN